VGLPGTYWRLRTAPVWRLLWRRHHVPAHRRRIHKTKESAVHLIALAPIAIALAMVIKGRRW